MAIRTAPNLSSTLTETWSADGERGPGLRSGEGTRPPAKVLRSHSEVSTPNGERAPRIEGTYSTGHKMGTLGA